MLISQKVQKLDKEVEKRLQVASFYPFYHDKIYLNKKGNYLNVLFEFEFLADFKFKFVTDFLGLNLNYQRTFKI